jgi:hypothetical protein
MTPLAGHTGSYEQAAEVRARLDHFGLAAMRASREALSAHGLS